MPKATSKVYSDAIFISGKMRLGDKTCHKGTYYYRPSGVEYGPTVAEEETVKFVITGGVGDKCSKVPIFVNDVESEEIPWKIDDVQNLEGRMFKRLRTNRDAGCQVIYQVTSRPTVNIPNEVGGHPDVEEVYVLEGEFTDYYEENEAWLISGAGTYVYRPPLSRHGQSVLARIPAKFFVKFYHPDLFERRNPVKGIPPASFEE